MTSITSAWQWSYDGWIIVVTSLVAVVCAIPGSFLLVRRQAMLGDAVAHAVLPGIAIGFLVSGSRGGGWMLVGAILAGLATAMLTQLLKGVAGVDRGSALGVVFSTLFAAGLLLIVQVADSIDLDPACVLYGQVELIPLELTDILGFDVPRVVPWMLTMLFAMCICVVICWKELTITSFDPTMADFLGISSAVFHQLLMVLVAVSCVLAFEAVGSLLVVSLLVAPPATARLLTNRLGPMLGVAVLIGVIAIIIGHVASISLPGWFNPRLTNLSIGGSIAVVATVIFIAVALLTASLRSFVHRSREELVG
ncbi:MAG: metal ABC transporter permease [Planctomycetes bacterium]|nr:metal ABC transporter permease [Planctomycetota bacterium]